MSIAPSTAPAAPAERNAPYGRDHELAQLLGCLDEAAGGHGQLVLVAGEAGIGKTTLVDALAREARRRGARILAGGCFDLATTPPYGAWIELLASYQPIAGELAPPPLVVGGAGVPPASRDVQFAAMRDFLRALTAHGPLVLLFEDQHWADADSLELLRELARGLRELAVLVVVTYRDAELTAQYPLYRYLPLLVREARPTRIALRRLDDATLERIVVSEYPLPPDDVTRLVDYLARYAEGNPFFTFELLRTLEHDGILARDAAGFTLGDLASAQVPLLVRQVIDARVAWLDEEARRLLQIAAVIGPDVSLGLWRAVAETSDETLTDAIEQALAAQLLADAPERDGLRFTHALVREAIYDALVLPRRRAWHRRAGELLSERPDADPDTVAHHFSRARDYRAAAWLVRAGERAASSNATHDAVERFEQALQILEQHDAEPDERVWLLCNLAEAYRYTDPAQAMDYLGRAHAIADPLDDPALHAIVGWSRARVRGFLGDNTLADLTAAEAAWHALTPAQRERVRVLGRGVAGTQGPFAQWLGHHGRFEAAIAVGRDCLAAYAGELSWRHRSELGHALCGVGLGEAALGRPEAAEHAFTESAHQFDRVGNAFMAAAALKWQLLEQVMPYRSDLPGERARLLDEYRRVWAQCTSFARWSGDTLLIPVFPPLIFAGEWDQVVTTAHAYSTQPFLRIDCLAALAAVERARGQRAAAWGRIRQALPNGPDSEPGSAFFVRTLALQRIACELALDDGQLELARAWIEAHDRWLAWSGRVTDRPAGPRLRARIAALAGDLPSALALARRSLALAEEPRLPHELLNAHRLLGALLSEAGQHDEALAQLDIALALADGCQAPYERALVQVARAEAHARAGQLAPLEAAAGDARPVLERLGAAPALGRLAVLASLQPARAGQPVPGGLSPRELEVLRLVAHGMTDAEVAERLFISYRTVGRHLQSVYNKLGVSSRTAATAFAFEHGLV